VRQVDSVVQYVCEAMEARLRTNVESSACKNTRHPRQHSRLVLHKAVQQVAAMSELHHI
jgi:hypothetical protein